MLGCLRQTFFRISAARLFSRVYRDQTIAPLFQNNEKRSAETNSSCGEFESAGAVSLRSEDAAARRPAFVDHQYPGQSGVDNYKSQKRRTTSSEQRP